MLKSITTLSDLKTLLNSWPIVVLDYTAPWCGPCKRLSPKIEEMAEEYKTCVLFVSLNVDEAEEIAKTFQVTELPMLQLFIRGKFIRFYKGVELSNLSLLLNEQTKWA